MHAFLWLTSRDMGKLNEMGDNMLVKESGGIIPMHILGHNFTCIDKELSSDINKCVLQHTLNFIHKVSQFQYVRFNLLS